MTGDSLVKNAHGLSIEACLQAVDSSPQGLSEQESAARLDRFGENRLPQERVPSVGVVFLKQFKSPLIYVLLFAGFVTLMLREYPGTVFIFAVLLINAVIGTFQEHSANRAAAALRKMTTSLARVRRDGEICEVDASKLVPGDIVLLESGNKIPADLRLIRTVDCLIDESLLTGESLAVTKDADRVLDEEVATGDRVNMAFAGTLLTRGRAEGVVVATGLNTRLGEIARQITEKSRARSPLLIRMERFTFRISVLIAVLILLISTALYFQGATPEQIFLIAVGLAVATIPEGLPVTLTIALAIGMQRMARRHVIVRRLVAVEALGSCTLIASDKTGTLTRNELTVEQVVFPGDATPSPAGRKSLFAAAVLANEAYLREENGALHGHGDAVDVALLMKAREEGFSREDLEKTYPPFQKIPYESALKIAASMHEAPQGEPLVFVKGAVETLLEMCCYQLGGGTERVPLNPAAIRRQEQSLSRQQYRVLAFAMGPIEKKDHYHISDLKELTFLGLMGMRDPLREEARPAIRACHEAGVEVVMITGDHPETARAIARDLSLVSDQDEVVSGRELEAAKAEGPAAVDRLTRDHRVFARVEPGQKLDIVDSLIRNGHFVAVTGDGVNDAPALKHAHVGVAMGCKGTDVARESAEIVLTDDNFASIVSGIEEGRTVYANIRKIVFFLISTSMTEIIMILAAILLSMPVPLYATQLLWLNFVTSIIQDVALAFDPPEGNELKCPPRNPKEPIFDRLMIGRIALVSGIMGLISFAEFYWMLNYGGFSEADARNLVLLQFVFFENVMVLNCRSETLSFFQRPLMTNSLLIYGTLAAQMLHIAAMYTPGLREALHIHPVSPHQWGLLLAVAFVIMLVIEGEKALRRRSARPASGRRFSFTDK